METPPSGKPEEEDRSKCPKNPTVDSSLQSIPRHDNSPRYIYTEQQLDKSRRDILLFAKKACPKRIQDRQKGSGVASEEGVMRLAGWGLPPKLY